MAASYQPRERSRWWSGCYNQGMRALLAIILSVFTIGYLLPLGVAIARSHRNTASIAIVNYFSGMDTDRLGDLPGVVVHARQVTRDWRW